MAEVVKHVADRGLGPARPGRGRRVDHGRQGAARRSAACRPWSPRPSRSRSRSSRRIRSRPGDAGTHLGHTFAAIEHVTGGRVNYGEAVAHGVGSGGPPLVRAQRLAEPGPASYVASLMAHVGLSVRLPDRTEPGKLVEAMRRDKKRRGSSPDRAAAGCRGRHCPPTTSPATIWSPCSTRSTREVPPVCLPLHPARPSPANFEVQRLRYQPRDRELSGITGRLRAGGGTVAATAWSTALSAGHLAAPLQKCDHRRGPPLAAGPESWRRCLTQAEQPDPTALQGRTA